MKELLMVVHTLKHHINSFWLFVMVILMTVLKKKANQTAPASRTLFCTYERYIYSSTVN